ncbi:MAG: translation initiation factor IF-2 [Pseudomonadota bacterium]
MSDTTTSKEREKKPLTLNKPGRLTLNKTVEAGQVRQSFSHGRSKQVTVEVKRKKTFARGAEGRMREVVAPPTPEPTEEPEATVTAQELEAGIELPRNLTEAERAVRLRALETAKLEEEQRRIEEELLAHKRAEEAAEAERRAKEEAAEREKVAAEAPPSPAEEAEPADSAEPAVPAPDVAAAAAAEPARSQAPAGKSQLEEQLGGRVKRKGADSKPTTSRRSQSQRRRHGKLTISQALEGDERERVRSLASVRRRQEKLRQAQARQSHQPPTKVIRDVVIPESLTVQELANRMAERSSEVIKRLMKMDVMATINQALDADTAELLVEEFGHRVKRVSAADVEIGMRGDPDAEESLKARPPVVTIMGHVDHGKTSLLDALRETDVAAHEAGGITQHIGAYQITLQNGDKITFIDTPGHAAFTQMRSRGANVTDIVVLVVSADDGVKEQTVEAINHAKAAEVPIIVAVNKIDRPEANPDRVKQELLQHDMVVEDLGGEVLCIEVSAKEKLGLDKLEEAILLQSELLELTANPDRNAEGAVIEAKLERGRGSVATILVQRGTLRVGDIFVTGSEWGRVRALVNERGESIDEAGPSVPVEVLGLNGTPDAGDDMVVVDSEPRAREIAEFREHTKRETSVASQGRGSVEQMLSMIKEGSAKEFPVVIKSDVHGSLEAIASAMEKIGNEEVKARVLHAAVGGINESDITLARSTGAMVIGFNVRANPQAREMAKRDNIDIHYYSIIYDVLDDMKAVLSGMLAPQVRERFLGYAEIREIFSITKVGKVAGCMITEGIVKRGAKVRLLRDDVVIHDGTLKTLRRFKDEVREVKEGYECGMAFENYQDIQSGDRIECYELEEVTRAL